MQTQRDADYTPTDWSRDSKWATAKSKGTRSGKPIGRPQRIFDRGEIIRLRQDGHSLAQIARQMNVGVGTVARAVESASG